MDYSVTTHAIRADGSVVVWGANVYNSAGNGLYAYTIIESDDVALGGGEAIEVANSVWNGLAIVRPAQPGTAPAHPLHWVSASIGDASIDESDGGTVDVTLSAAVTTPVTVEYDFDGVTGSVVVPAGATSAPIALSVTDDAISSGATISSRWESLSSSVRPCAM